MTEPCPHGRPTPRARAAVVAALAYAEAACTEAGESWTAQRRRVYELLLGSVQPVKAYELLTKLRVGAVAKPPTVYRVLDFLLAQGLAHRLESEAAFVACTLHDDHDGTVGFLICDCCRRVEEVTLDESDVRDQAILRGFTIRRTVMEAHGRCPRCAAGDAVQPS